MASIGEPHRRSFAAGEQIFDEGDLGDVAYIVESGSIALTRELAGEMVRIATLGTGEIVGEMALIDDAPRSASAVAEVDTQVFVIERDLLRQHIAMTNPMIELLMRVLLDRLRSTHEHLSESEPGLKSTVENARRNYHDAELRAIDLFKFEHELKRGLGDGQFEVTLQPIVHLSDARIAGFEALMIWHHPQRGRLAPASFIEIAERSGLVRQLDDLALSQALGALADIKRHLGAPADHLRISVNLSGVHADDVSTVSRVARVIEAEGFDANFLTLEITESWLVRNPERAQETLFALKELGLSLALDDFGTGYSSLGYLHRFPMDFLKVDRSFTEMMATSEGSENIVRAVIGLAHTFGMEAVAEGIDDPAQIEILQRMNCEFGQGYHFSRPLNVDDARSFTAECLS
ncbi:MAG: EAL domain-containing protein [Alphaproteobacteria bacterium]|jgi:EAL domain-containing protein (putative c-di-GMP-specific phosphodiesterase class I)|nr:EAL domain-containing protein [Alphaproteobacteria bacterium]